MANIIVAPKQEITAVEMRADAERFPRINAVPQDEAIRQLVQIITTAFMYRGQRADDQDVAFIAVNLYDEIIKDEYHTGMNDISFEEIKRIIKKGVLGQSKELFGINVSSIYALIAEYSKGEGRMAMEKVLNQRKLERHKVLEASPLNVMIGAMANKLIKK